jgi:hypothetical protein
MGLISMDSHSLEGVTDARLDGRNVLKGMLRALDNDVILLPRQIEAEIISAIELINPTEGVGVEVVEERER